MGDALPAEIDGFRRLWAWVHEAENAIQAFAKDAERAGAR